MIAAQASETGDSEADPGPGSSLFQLFRRGVEVLALQLLQRRGLFFGQLVAFERFVRVVKQHFLVLVVRYGSGDDLFYSFL